MRFFQTSPRKSSPREGGDPPPSFSDIDGGGRDAIKPYQEAPGYTAKEIYQSSRGKGTPQKRNADQNRSRQVRGRSVSKERTARASSSNRDGRAKMGSPQSQASSPRSVPPAPSPSPRSSSRSPTKASQSVKLTKSAKKEPLLPEDMIKAASASTTLKNSLGLDDSKDVPVYQPPVIPEPDSTDAACEDDRYATVGPQDSLVNLPPEELMASANPPLVTPAHQRHPLRSHNDDESFDKSKPHTIQALAKISSYLSNQSRYGDGASVYAREPVVSEMDSDTFFDEPSTTDPDLVNCPRKATSAEFRSFGEVESGLFLSSDGDIYSEQSVILVKQRVAYLCIVLSALQLGIVFIQLTLCGMASLHINPMVGPYPDAFSEWGGKNVYLLLEEKQYFRLITPVFLHVGVLHFLVNAYCQLETCAYFEREWGSIRWLVIYFMSGIGSVLTASAIDPDLIGVCSSGALMGMFGAKIAQVITWTIFDLRTNLLEQSIQFDQLGGVMCSAAMVSLLSFLTFIDWSGNLGGLVTGFLAGITFFSKPIANGCFRFLWASLGFVGLAFGGTVLARILFFKTEPDADLSDACQYFRTLYPEGYNCDCVWD
jgi:membrane associated rhomboid family serine protease